MIFSTEAGTSLEPDTRRNLAWSSAFWRRGAMFRSDAPPPEGGTPNYRGCLSRANEGNEGGKEGRGDTGLSPGAPACSRLLAELPSHGEYLHQSDSHAVSRSQTGAPTLGGNDDEFIYKTMTIPPVENQIMTLMNDREQSFTL